VAGGEPRGERIGLHEALAEIRRGPATAEAAEAVDATEAVDGADADGAVGRRPFVWVDLHRPSAESFEALERELGLHPLAVEDAVRAHQRPKLELYGDVLFAVLKTVGPRETDGGVSLDSLAVGELMLFLGADFVVTVRHDPADGHTALGAHSASDLMPEVRQRLAESPPELRGCPTGVLHSAFDTVVDDYLGVAAELDAELAELEADAFADQPPPQLAERIYAGKRRLVAFRRSTGPLLAPVLRLAGGGTPQVPDAARPFFRNVADHLARVAEQVEVMERQLSDILDANLTQASIRQNDDMRKISAWAALAAVPTLIAGVYGMNFQWMPDLRLTWGYPAVIVLMAVVCWVLYRVFKRSGRL
jgi:magnesium transporter